MTDVGGERGHAGVHVDALPIPPEDRPDDERVPQIVNACLGALNAGKAKESCEGTVDVVVDEACAGERNEETWGARARMDAVALLFVTKERTHSGVVQDNLARFANLLSRTTTS
jgi:hypothetical protein